MRRFGFSACLLLGVLVLVNRVSAGGHGGDDGVDEAKSGGDVLVLTQENFDSTLAEQEVALVKFYAPWCGHCKHLAPEYKAAAAELKPLGISLYDVNAEKEKDLASKYKVHGYPALYVFRHGENTEYNGPREAKGIVSYMKKQAGPAIKQLDNVTQLQEFLNEPGEQYGVVAFLADGSEKRTLYSAIILTANKLRDKFRFGRTSNADCFTKYKLDPTKDHLIAFKKFDDLETEYNSTSFATSQLEKFISENSLPLVGEINKQNQDVYEDKRLPIVKFFLPIDWKNEKLMNFYVSRLKEVATQYRGKLLFGLVDLSGPNDLDQIGMSKLPTPLLALIENPHKKFHFDATFKVPNIQKWLKDWEEGKAQQFIKSEPLPEDDDDEGVKILAGSTFDSIITKDVDAMILFYAPWCGHCKEFHPKYHKLAKKLKNVPKLIISKIDATANDYPATYNVHGFPTIYFKPAGKAPIEYSGERDVGALVTFIKKNAVNPIEIRKPKKDKKQAEL